MWAHTMMGLNIKLQDTRSTFLAQTPWWSGVEWAWGVWLGSGLRIATCIWGPPCIGKRKRELSKKKKRIYDNHPHLWAQPCSRGSNLSITLIVIKILTTTFHGGCDQENNHCSTYLKKSVAYKFIILPESGSLFQRTFERIRTQYPSQI